jgi:hypothetical protein
LSITIRMTRVQETGAKFFYKMERYV